MESKRKEWIDALRAVAMLIVMMWHISIGCENQWIYSLFTSPLMIPLFFIISGYVFNDCDGNQSVFFKKIFKYLIYPWLALALLKGGVNTIIRGSFDYYIEFLCNLFTGTNLWYFPCCIIAEIVFFYSKKKCQDCNFLIFISLVITLLGASLSKYAVFDNLNLSTALICQIFLVFGYTLKNYDFKFNKKLIWGSSIFYVGIISIINLLPAPIACDHIIPMDIHKNYFYFAPICFFLIFVGNFSLFGLAQMKIKYSKLLLFIGRNTIVFYVFHYDTLLPFNMMINILGISVEPTWILAILKLLWSLVCCTIIALCLNKFTPQLVGKRKQV